MTPEERIEAERILRELNRRKANNKIDSFFASSENRAGYPVHMRFFEAGATYTERMCLAANRVGKSESILCYEVALHMTGIYPDWWKGRKFTRPVKVWLGGDTSTTVRDILQQKLVGDLGSQGTGMLRGSLIEATTNKRGVPDAIEIVKVKHSSGGISTCAFKSYDQGREAWQGTEQDIVGLDEEPPEDVYSEAMIRTMTTGGMVLITYTPMHGMTEVTRRFMEASPESSKFLCTATWDDVLHLSAETKKKFWEETPEHLRKARAKGIPTIGAGQIYNVDVERVTVEPFDLPKHWVRAYALDVGWNRTAAVWGALDRETDTLYVYSEHYMGQESPVVHASAIKARGDITGFIDPASQGRSQKDGERLIDLYRNEGLKLELADNSVEAGIFDVHQRMTTGRLRIFNTLPNLLKEIPLYHRNKEGQIVKKNDHALDCLRYLVRANQRMTYASAASEAYYAVSPSGVQYMTSRPKRYRSI